MFYKDYLKTKHWRVIRKRKLAANDFFGLKKCAICDTDKNLQVHHLTYKNLWNENNKTLRILCNDCHRILSFLPKLKGNGRIIKKWLKLRKQVLEIKEACI